MMLTLLQKNANIPGFQIEAYPGFPELIVLRRMAGGYVTLDTDKRIFNGGHAPPHCMPAGRFGTRTVYHGSGWLLEMTRDAAAWLEETMK